MDKDRNESDLTKIAIKHHAWVESKGWHNKTPLEYLALISSEVGEAVQECRGILPTEDLQYELADIVLRVMDLSVELNINLYTAIQMKMADNSSKVHNPHKVK